MDTFTSDVLEVIRKTRDLSRPQFGTAEALHNKGGDATDAVTEVDQNIEKFLSYEFKKIDPNTAFVGEEYGGDRTAQKFWLVDPIDGTGVYLRGLPFCTTMVALIENNEVIFSALYNFVEDIMYHATRGDGAFANGDVIHVSERDIDNSYIGYESRIEKEANQKLYMEVKKQCAPLKFMTAGYEYIAVATGKLEARVTYDPYGYDYDFAPGSLLVAEAGGVVTNIGSKTYNYTNLNSIAANPKVHKALTEGSDALFPVAD